MNRHLLVFCGLLLAAPVSANFTLPQEPLRFDVSLDDRAIGYHVFDFSGSSGGQFTVDVDAAFDVRVLLIPVFSYQHSNQETWRGGCLQRIESTTDSNGTRFDVSGVNRGDVFELSGGGASKRLETDCLMSFAYWDPRLLEQRQLLNAQTGEVVDVAIDREGEERVDYAGQRVAADVYRIRDDSGDVDIRLWYAQETGQWLRLESRLPNSRVLRYLREPAKGALDSDRVVVR